MIKKFLVVALFTAVTLSVAPPTSAVSVAAGTSSSVQTSKRLDELGERLTNKYYALLQSKDIRGLREFLSPAFQLQRANGTGADRSEYLADLPTISDFAVSDLVTTRVGDTLVVRFVATVAGSVDGSGFTPGPAPRISTYVRNDGRWRLVSHANFNTLQG